MPASLINNTDTEEQPVLGGKIPTTAKPPKVNPAAQSLKQFGSMINKNIIQPAKNVLGYPGQVIAGTVNQAASGLESLGNTIKENYNKDLDYSQLAKSSLDPTNPYGNNYNPNAQAAPVLGGEQPVQPGTGEQAAQQVQPNEQGAYPDGSLVPGSPAFKENLAQYRVGTETLNANIDAREEANPNFAQTEPYTLNDNLTINQPTNQPTEVAKEGMPTLGNDYYADVDIKPAFQGGAGGFNEIDKSKLVDEKGFPAYVDGQQVSAPLFDNTYMKKRYGEDVEKPRTEAERIAEGKSVNERRDKYLSSLEGKGTIRQQQIGMAEKQYEDKKKSDASAAVSLGEQNRLSNKLASRKQAVDEYKALNPNFEMIKTKDYDDMGIQTGESVKGAFNPATGRSSMLGGDQSRQKSISNLSKDDQLRLAGLMNKAPENPVVMKEVDNYLSQFGLNYESFLAQQTKR